VVVKIRTKSAVFLGLLLIQENEVEYDEGPGNMIQEPPFNSLRV
jgi:hypothetical protein